MERVLSLFASELEATENAMREAITSDIPNIPQIINHITSSGGKRFRPLLLLSCAAMFNYRDAKRFRFAAIIEFIHTATLLHDDVVDVAQTRRGQESANKKWGNAASVLTGDFLLASSMLIMAQHGDMEVIRIVANMLRLMSEGEILQLNKSGRGDTSEKDYLRIVQGKTAALTSAACEVGARLAGASAAQQRALAQVGLHIGTVFQITDDILDYSSDKEEMGKDINQDISEGKMTLPLIHAMEKASREERMFMQEALTHGKITPAKREKVISLVVSYGGIEYARSQSSQRIKDVRKILGNFPASPAQESLLTIAEYAASRSK
ncbi:MAG: polyprenyl synthetase family protein [Deltaproteobacteria bacterium]|nr:polyprenyl synthetase family protein [Deltaproteobacteria bacterium]